MKKAFTLIEFLSYLAVFALLATAVSSFYHAVITANAKSQAMLSVEEQGSFISNIINRYVRRAQSINSPTIGASANTLSLAMSGVGENPAIFATSSQALNLSLAGVAEPLTDNNIEVISLVFSNYSIAGVPQIVSYRFLLKHKNPANRQEYNYIKEFSGSAHLRK
jgi:type II secretory pathway component PulJ